MITKLAAVGSAIGLLAFAGVTLAESENSMKVAVRADAQAKVSARQAMVLQVNPNGKILLRGTVTATTSDTLTLKSWGGSWSVKVSSNTEILPKGASIADFKQGDFVGVEGSVSTSADFTIDARVVRDWNIHEVIKQERKENRETVRDVMKALMPRNFEGTLSALSGQSFTLTSGSGATYQVTLASGASILQRNWLTLDFSQVQNGDKVRVWGPSTSATASTSATITTSVFRDLSIPR